MFTMCLASMYMKTDNVIFQGKDYITYSLHAGIKQGLPLSPMLFLFYVNDVFDFFHAIYRNSCDTIYDIVHLIMHADDATLISSSRALAVRKLSSMLQYCSRNHIIPQYSKCEFVVINGDSTDTAPLPFGGEFLNNVGYITLLGSHLTAKGTLMEDLKIHMQTRYISCIKFYNFLRANKLAPLSVKLKVLKACVVNSILFNCETFGSNTPKDLDKIYQKLLKCTFNVRMNTPILTLFVESGFMPIKTLILTRQLKFFNRYKQGLLRQSPRVELFNRLMVNPTSYLKHYIDISNKYNSIKEIYEESSSNIKNEIRNHAENGKYKYKIYLEINPELRVSPFINNFHALCKDMIRVRLGSHCLPIETGRWGRVPRE